MRFSNASTKSQGAIKALTDDFGKHKENMEHFKADFEAHKENMEKFKDDFEATKEATGGTPSEGVLTIGRHLPLTKYTYR